MSLKKATIFSLAIISFLFCVNEILEIYRFKENSKITEEFYAVVQEKLKSRPDICDAIGFFRYSSTNDYYHYARHAEK